MIDIGVYDPMLAYRLMEQEGETDTCVHFMESLLKLNPKECLSAEEALDHPWFQEYPRPCSNEHLK